MSSSFNTINIKQNEKMLKIMTKKLNKWVVNFVLHCYGFSYLEKQWGFH
jgi:cystathionine beta-lyase family protein involved in aluminum resistance